METKEWVVTSPDGREFIVSAPVSATEQEVRAYAQRNFAQAEPEQQSMGDQALRAGGLAGRIGTQGLVQGLGALPALASDANDSLRNLLAQGINAVGGATGLPIPQQSTVPPFRNTRAVADAGKRLADFVGFPKPQSEFEQKVDQYGTDITGALTAAGGAKALSNQIAKRAPSVAPMPAPVSTPLGMRQAASGVPATLAQYPGQQAVGAGAATYAGNTLAQNPGATDWAGDFKGLLDTGLVLGAGAVAPSGMNTAGNLGNRGLQVVRPFTEEGQRGIAGTILRKFATNPDRAMDELRVAQDVLPGSRMTTGEVARDPGLAGAQTPLFKALDNRNLAGERASDRNAVRVEELRRLSGANPKRDGQDNETVLEYATRKRDEVTGPMREGAFSANMTPPEVLNSATTLAVESTINRILAGNKGTRVDVEKAMQFVRDRLGRPIDTPERLYAIRKDLRDASIGAYDQPGATSGMKVARGELEDVIRTIDDVIDSAAPGYKSYISRYARMSQPIDQMEIIGHLRKAADSASIDVTRSRNATAGDRMGAEQFPLIMAGKLKAAMESQRMQKDGQKLSPVQQATLDKVMHDLRSEMSVSGGNRISKQPGSDTFKNMTVANVVGHVMGDFLGSTQAAKTVTAPFQWLYKLPENQVADLLVDAMLDPTLARELISRASTVKIQRVSEALKNKAIGQGLVIQSGSLVDSIPR